MATPYLFCFGLGYSAQQVAHDLKVKGWRVGGTCRSEDKRAELEADGFEAHLFDGTQDIDLDIDLAGVTHVLVSVPPNAEGDPVMTQDLDHVDWLGYFSTTGVYGNRDGGWVDEKSTLLPTSDRSRYRAEAERRWMGLHLDRGLPVHIFRLAGIYGPGRSPLDQVQRGTAKRISSPGQLFSRIHVEDISMVLQASMAHPDPGAIYNVCDDEPAAPSDVIAYACELLGVEPPLEIPIKEVEMSAMARTFWNDNKKVRNNKIKADLGVTLAYPTYREGLKAGLPSA